jgi:hypothetical protein
METLSSPRDSRFIALAPLIGILLLYVLVAAAMVGNVLGPKHAHVQARAIAQTAQVPTAGV